MLDVEPDVILNPCVELADRHRLQAVILVGLLELPFLGLIELEAAAVVLPEPVAMLP
jgi:hypothetical protein